MKGGSSFARLGRDIPSTRISGSMNWLFWLHMQQKGNFLARMSTVFGCVKEFIASGKKPKIKSGIIRHKLHESLLKKKNDTELPDSLPPIPLRLIRVELSGETEVLATSLLDEQRYPAEAFGQLYHQRWKVETFFDRLKNKINLELFSGHLPIVIEQDFFASILLANILEICIQKLHSRSENNNPKSQKSPQKKTRSNNLNAMSTRSCERSRWDPQEQAHQSHSRDTTRGRNGTFSYKSWHNS